MKTRIIIFLIILALGFSLIGFVMKPNWNYPRFDQNVGYNISEFGKHDYDVDCFFVGTSHMEYGISPMYIYDRYGLVTYNIATSAQTALISKHLISKVYDKGYHPKVIVYDVSNLFNRDQNEASYRHITDNQSLWDSMPLIWDYLNLKDKVTVSDYLEWMLPVYKYHSRWEKLNSDDFRISDHCNYFMQGFYILPYIMETETDADKMDRIADLTIANQESEKYSADGSEVALAGNGKDSVRLKKSDYYNKEIPDENLRCLEEIHELCRKNSCELILVKVPVMKETGLYQSAWTRARYEQMKQVADDHQIPFLDLAYDAGPDMDWSHDTCDGGAHLNLLGAEKVSDYLAEYLKDQYALEGRNLPAYDQKSLLYNEYAEVAHLELAPRLDIYFDSILNNENYVLLMAAKDDMRSGLQEEDMDALKSLGLITDFEHMECYDSYIAIIDGGEAVYEGTSNRQMTYEKDRDFGHIKICSAGYLDGNTGSISINGTDYAMNQRGINFVVYDKASGFVIDRSCYDAEAEEQELIHDCGDVLFRYQNYLMNR